MPRLERALMERKGSTNSSISIASITDFDWDTLVVFQPYTPVEKVQAELGYNWSEAARTHIDSSDTFYLLVFVKDGKVVSHFSFPRTIGDFQGLQAQNKFSRGDGTFEVKTIGAGGSARLNLLPLHKNPQH